VTSRVEGTAQTRRRRRANAAFDFPPIRQPQSQSQKGLPERKRFMIDPRVTKLADVLVNYSCALKPGERLLIEAIDVPHEFTCECIGWHGRPAASRWSSWSQTASNAP
jgi:hypothetical protein